MEGYMHIREFKFSKLQSNGDGKVHILTLKQFGSTYIKYCSCGFKRLPNTVYIDIAEDMTLLRQFGWTQIG